MDGKQTSESDVPDWTVFLSTDGGVTWHEEPSMTTPTNAPPDPIAVMISSGVNTLLAAGMILRYRSRSGSSYYLGWPGRKGVLRISDHANLGREQDDAIYAKLTIHRSYPPKEANFKRHLAQALGYYLMKAPPGV